VDAWRPGAFAVVPFAPPPEDGPPDTDAARRARADRLAALPLAFRRFRLPIPVRVRVDDGRPVRVTTDRRGISGGAIVQAAGPWRSSGEWWIGAGTSGEKSREGGELRGGEDRDRDCAVSGALPESHNGEQSRESSLPSRSASASSRESFYSSRQSSPWDRDEWDIAMADGTVYRLFIERDVGQWFLEGVFD
jgi:hypothetical protein